MTSSSPSPRDRIIPYYFVAFFLFIAAVDGVMVTLAVRTQTGLVTEHPYEKGLAYNRVVEAADAQDRLGWKGGISFQREDATSGMVSFRLADAEGAALKADSIRAEFVRPTQAGMDFSLALTQPSGQRISFPAPGLWEIRIKATVGNHEYQQNQRIVVE